MKTALLTIAAMALVYFAIIKSNSRDEDYRIKREEAREQADELERQNRTDILNLEAEDRRRERRRKEAATEMAAKEMREALRAANSVPEPAVAAPAPTEPTAGKDGSFGQYADRIFTVKGDAGHGSGFICEINGKPVAVTNTHVLSGNTSMTFARPDGKVIAVAAEQLSVAMDRDLAFFPLTEKQAALGLAPPSAGVKIGDAIACFGNTLGQSVITDVRGTILGLGPKDIEIDAHVMQGNSGCPVIHIASGTVVGVVTRGGPVQLSSHNEGTRFAEVRRFCLKIEGSDWKQIGWAVFAKQAKLIGSYSENREHLQALILNLAAGMLDPAGYETCSLRLQGEVRTFIAAHTSAGLGGPDKRRAQAAFLREFAWEVKKGKFDDDLVAMEEKAAGMCEFHRRKLTEEVNIREAIMKQVVQLEQVTIAIARSAAAPVVPSRPRQPGPYPPR